MFNMCFLVLSLLGLLGSAVGSILQDGQCDPNLTLQDGVNIDNYLTTWYVIKTSDTGSSDCFTFTFSQENGEYIAKKSEVNSNFEESVNGVLSVDPNNPAKISVVWDDGTSHDFWVLLRDDFADAYLVTYSCEQITEGQKSVSTWALRTEPTSLTTFLYNMFEAVLRNVNIEIADLNDVLHDTDRCYVLPVISPGNPIIIPGQCDPNINVVQNFNVETFTGVWHEYASYVSENSRNQCSRAEYTLNGNVVEVLNSQVIDQTLDTISGTASVASDDGSAKLNVLLNVGTETVARELYILATDYQNYAVSYSCENIGSTEKRVYSWILSKSRTITETSLAAVTEVIASELDLNNIYYQLTDQSDTACFFYPEHVENQIVKFRGLCDDNIPVQEDFNAEIYTGIWHNIASYPANFETGTCRNANYELNGGRVDVVNTQVINQLLDAINGEASITSTDGSAKLEVTFPVAGTTETAVTKYWVLSTDYSTYSLVYSCVDIEDSEERQVFAWKLSREKELSPDASNTINEVMSSIPVLREQYFQSVDQSPEGCFYFPEPQPDVPVVFPGQCDDSIAAVSNFDLNAFGDTWNVIEAYPDGQQDGQCKSKHYSPGPDNSLNLQTSQIINQFLDVSSGVLSFSSTTDNSGKLTLTTESGTEVPFWILSTDYENYALAYSCINQGSDYRAIQSWKLSRTKVLSTNAINSFNTIISGINVLDDVYYQSVDQSDEACFYLPELEPGAPVVIVGQCDPNINVVANFDPSRYLGTWRLIESYPADFQTGTCSRATYSINADSNVNVYNTQVINEELDTINGVAVAQPNGVLLVTFPGSTTPSEYYVLATDYDNYALVYSCQNINSEQRRVWSWKMSRSDSLSAQDLNAISQTMNEINVLNDRYFQQVDQSDEACFYFPQPDPNTPVRFRGRCNQNIGVMQNFDPSLYLGLWHNIELYPSVFQTGTCNNAIYSPGVDGAVDVLNSQVVGQQLLTVRGEAVLASDDGSGRLDVTFPVAGTEEFVTLNYWVLGTDYNSYSLVYTCDEVEEEDDYYSTVYSWKLSKSKSLSTEALQSVNELISGVKVLDSRYYRVADQSAEGCFYFPEPQPDVPVVFPGQCDDSIAAMPNFDLNAFSRTWRVVETYPDATQEGQCLSKTFSTGESNTLNLQSSQIINQFLETSAGVLTYISNTDNSAKLTLTTESGEVIPFWVLSTDYNDYALAYSCVNQGSDFRAIHSWKLSTSTELSPNAITAINEAISSIDVLNNNYYVPVDHSDEACFYLPELEPGAPVIIVGQCDSSINVVENFDPARYLGTWRLIESYPADFQTGTCSRATYSINADSNVNVYNTQVINEELDTINGVAVAQPNGVLLVTFPGSTTPSEYYVLATDYDNYALVYSCQNINSEQRRVWSWKMSRSDSLSAEDLNAISQTMNEINVLNDRYFQQVDQSDEACFYFPQPDPNTPVRFRGRCNQNIGVMQNFDPSLYLGLWHNIELYPSVFQTGTCNNAIYSPGVGGAVDVLNSQVVGQQLLTVRGEAVLASDDGSGRLDVTFPVAGTEEFVTLNYWVLGTDYNSYSLVYTCDEVEEEDDYYSTVYSWKLSKSKSLSTEALQSVNELISGVKVLDSRYYRVADQSAEGCFYFPEPQPDVPVVFPGQCDDSIAAMPNFDLNAFSRTWRVVETYPDATQEGQCLSKTYLTGESNTLNLQSSQIINQFLETSAGVLTYTSNTDNSAKLTLTTESGDVIPFWVLSTDYNDYALAYSCVNQGSDFRAIHSWKLSTSTELSPNAITAINEAISSIDVLNNNYYVPVDHSDEACFYLPDLEPGAPVIIVGQCDSSINVVENFDPARYLGTWRLIESYPADFQTGTCSRATYSINADSNVNVYNTQVINEELDTINGVAVAQPNGVLLVTFPGSTTPSEYYVLATDYDNYALVYSCQNINSEQRRVWSWKMSRSDSLSAEDLNAISQTMNEINVLNDRYFQQVDQSDEACFYFPQPDPNTPVRFRGRCNQNIGVMQNFDPSLYLGLWHNIELYPSVFQTGTCNNAIYSPGVDGAVDVLNSQVVGQQLLTVRGEAVLASVDGSGRLDVTFPVAGTEEFVTLNYWVLGTDYNSYSLVYTCDEVEEEDDYYSTVYSWKLSKSKSLSTEALQSVNELISGVKVLDSRYYRVADQSAEGCFYFPEPQPDVPVVFPGQCDDSIAAMPNFDLNAFSRTWRVVETYPDATQEGQCLSKTFSTGESNTLNLQSSQIINQFLETSAGVLTYTSNTDNSAKLTLTTESGDVIPFWVLSTDYNDYALAYSCVNQGSDFRAIHSWKLSTSTELSPNAITAINEAISSIDVLNNNYYVPVDHSDEACFYLPDLEPGAPVIIVGQCDSSINVVENFDPARYLGTWRLIESYPADFQTGTCSRATYSINADSNVNVYNTQVINEELDTINGVAVAQPNGVLLVTFPGSTTPSEYYVLATDYDNYALVYSCQNINSEQRRVWSWKMSRSDSLSAEDLNAISQTMNEINVLNDRYFQQVDQSDEACFYFPQPDPNTPVRFRGRCNQNIGVMQNFDPSLYLGLWHNIELYPSVFQTGTCNNAIYSPGVGGAVDVLNSQVVGQQLLTVRGEAVLASDDGSGRLDVTFPVAGTEEFVTLNYWVLGTDYNSYSLVYTCDEVEEEDDYYSTVYSWKLSKSKSLSTEALQSVNELISGVKVLDSRYYRVADQSAEGCFYFPEPQPGVPVVFPGQCDDSVSVVPDFDLEAFQRVWHVVEAYPLEQVEGQCVSQELTSNGLTLELKQVSYETLIVDTGTVSSADNSARLTYNLVINGQALTIPFWILSVDYNDYALAYSCISHDDDTRSVFSWKLSRNKLLSPEAVSNINAAISSVDVLQEQYYEPVDQSDEACFYLPDLQPGEPVVFPGQCDLTIPAVPNFNPVQYSGTWRTIQTYYSDFQDGTCGQATYELAEDGQSVYVYNTQVIDETLDQINGTAVLASTDNSGLLSVQFPTAPEPAAYWVLATDYLSYSLVYSCRNINSEQRQVWAWKLGRERALSTEAIDEINLKMETINVLNDRYFVTEDQSDDGCFYFPEPNGQPVEFRGQCDETISVVADFDASRYEGLWYDIESYPQIFQAGTCATAEYTLNGGVVNVVNTQVLNQQQDIITATAVLATSDGSGKLDVTFPVAGTSLTVTTPYWILDTNYDDYSLVYSCQNINTERYRVTSWKLSREAELSPPSSAAIATAINNVKVLREEYYEVKGHGEEDCFFYPDNNGGPVILDGQCASDEEIQVVENFNANSFAGVWYEIERFPSEINIGECVRNQYVFNQNSFTISKTIVNNEELLTLNGGATVSSDSRGILTVSVSDGGSWSYNGKIYVLDTDYSTYALLYGCRNIDESTKQVYSWKLSNSQTGLSNDANENINNIVTREKDLFQNYYEETGQDTNACFYYPVFTEPQTSIILPGPCDQSITGVANFNPSAYVDKWHVVESYPDPTLVGTCNREIFNQNGAQFNVNANHVLDRILENEIGTASVFNSGVLDVTLGGQTRREYIIATDYSTYSLIYSCINLNDGRSEVFSRILSRSKVLSPEAHSSIQTAIASTRGLREEYYEDISQSDEDCFYVPAVTPNQAPQFRGQCENFASGTVQNFEQQTYFSTWWHDIQSYHSEEDAGQCVSTRYSSSGNQFQFVETRVFGLNDGRQTTGTVTGSANGVLVKTYSDGSTRTLWVVATDYETYSVLLSCEDIDEEYIKVWSVVQSSTQALTETSQAAVEAVFEGNDLLYNQFYQAISQDDESCFYYPPQDGNRVVLPGQCDENIPTQSNFVVDDYTGTWYQIERYAYPEVSADSTCIGTRYTLDEENEDLDVTNWKADGDELKTINGRASFTNGTGKFNLVLQLDPEDVTATTTNDLYILSTDYVSYALVFTCRNIEYNQRVVVAIKLSRTRSIPNSGVTAINNYINQRRELNPEYFINVEHNDECRDPSASYLIKSSITLTLVCFLLQKIMW